MLILIKNIVNYLILGSVATILFQIINNIQLTMWGIIPNNIAISYKNFSLVFSRNFQYLRWRNVNVNFFK